MIGRGGARDQTLMLLAVCPLAKEGRTRGNASRGRQASGARPIVVNFEGDAGDALRWEAKDRAAAKRVSAHVPVAHRTVPETTNAVAPPVKCPAVIAFSIAAHQRSTRSGVKTPASTSSVTG